MFANPLPCMQEEAALELPTCGTQTIAVACPCGRIHRSFGDLLNLALAGALTETLIPCDCDDEMTARFRVLQTGIVALSMRSKLLPSADLRLLLESSRRPGSYRHRVRCKLQAVLRVLRGTW